MVRPSTSRKPTEPLLRHLGCAEQIPILYVGSTLGTASVRSHPTSWHRSQASAGIRLCRKTVTVAPGRNRRDSETMASNWDVLTDYYFTPGLHLIYTWDVLTDFYFTPGLGQRATPSPRSPSPSIASCCGTGPDLVSVSGPHWGLVARKRHGTDPGREAGPYQRESAVYRIFVVVVIVALCQMTTDRIVAPSSTSESPLFAGRQLRKTAGSGRGCTAPQREPNRGAEPHQRELQLGLNAQIQLKK